MRWWVVQNSVEAKFNKYLSIFRTSHNSILCPNFPTNSTRVAFSYNLTIKAAHFWVSCLFLISHTASNTYISRETIDKSRKDETIHWPCYWLYNSAYKLRLDVNLCCFAYRKGENVPFLILCIRILISKWSFKVKKKKKEKENSSWIRTNLS